MSWPGHHRQSEQFASQSQVLVWQGELESAKGCPISKVVRPIVESSKETSSFPPVNPKPHNSATPKP